MTPVFSVICVYNNAEKFRRCLLAGLEGQTASFELIAEDNSGGKFKSAAQGLTTLAKKATGQYLLFIHQDVKLPSKKWLADAEQLLANLPALAIAGIAGTTAAKNSPRLLFTTDPNPVKISYSFAPDEPEPKIAENEKPVQAETLDEQLLIIPAAEFAMRHFDENVCGGWHLYGADYALSAARDGLKAYILPLAAEHDSEGTLNADYFNTLQKLFSKHADKNLIGTTCGLWHRRNFANLTALFCLSVRSRIAKLRGRNKKGSAPYRAALRWFFSHLFS